MSSQRCNRPKAFSFSCADHAHPLFAGNRHPISNLTSWALWFSTSATRRSSSDCPTVASTFTTSTGCCRRGDLLSAHGRRSEQCFGARRVQAMNKERRPNGYLVRRSCSSRCPPRTSPQSGRGDMRWRWPSLSRERTRRHQGPKPPGRHPDSGCDQSGVPELPRLRSRYLLQECRCPGVDQGHVRA